MYLEYLSHGSPTYGFDAFGSAMTALRCGDANPLRLYLGLPLQGECEDCEQSRVLVESFNALCCKDCAMLRRMELESFLDHSYEDWMKRDTYSQ